MWTQKPSKTPIHNLFFASLVAVLLITTACSSNDETANEGETASDSASENANGSELDDNYVAPDDYVGYQIIGEAGVSVKVISEVQAEAYTPAPTEQMWELQGRPVHMLFDETTTSGRITFEIIAGDAAQISIIRGVREDPSTNISPVEVTEVLSEADLNPSGPITLDFDVRDQADESNGSEIAPAPDVAEDELEEAEG